MTKELLKLPFSFAVIFSKIAKAKGYRLAERLSLFSTMMMLWVKALLTHNSDHLVSCKLLKFRVSAYGYHTLFYLIDEIFLKSVYQVELDCAKPVILDCGANIGISSLYFKHRYPDAEIYCFEPNPTVFELLEVNILGNKLQDVKLFNVALSDFEGEMDFYVGEERGSFISSADASRGGTHTKVPARRISGEIKGKIFDLIKIDVEGSEWQIIQDIDAAGLMNVAKQYVIEYHHNLPGSERRFGDFLNYFEKNGLSYIVEAEKEKFDEPQCIMLYVKTTKP